MCDACRIQHSLGIRKLGRPRMFTSAIHGKDLTRNIRGYVAEKEDGGICDVLHIACTSSRDGGIISQSSRQSVHTFRTAYWAWSNYIRANPVWAFLNSEDGRQRIDRCLCCGDMRLEWRAYMITVSINM